MRRINKEYEITNNTIADFKTGTQQHIENSIQELGHMLVKSLFPSFDDSDGAINIISGCINSGSGANFIISAGVISYKDPNSDEVEFFYVNASTFTVTGGNQAVAVINTASYTGNVTQGDVADPTGMSDTTTQSIHDIRTIDIINGSASSPEYIGAYSSFINLVGTSLLRATFRSTINVATQNNVTTTSYSDLPTPMSITTPNDGITRDLLLLFTAYNQTVSADPSYLDFIITDGVTTFATINSGKISAGANELDIPMTMQKIVLAVPPNTTIKIQAKYIGNTGDIKKADFSVMEIR